MNRDRIIVERLRGHWSAWFDGEPQVAFGGATLKPRSTCKLGSGGRVKTRHIQEAEQRPHLVRLIPRLAETAESNLPPGDKLILLSA